MWLKRIGLMLVLVAFFYVQKSVAGDAFTRDTVLMNGEKWTYADFIDTVKTVAHLTYNSTTKQLIIPYHSDFHSGTVTCREQVFTGTKMTLTARFDECNWGGRNVYLCLAVKDKPLGYRSVTPPKYDPSVHTPNHFVVGMQAHDGNTKQAGGPKEFLIDWTKKSSIKGYAFISKQTAATALLDTSKGNIPYIEVELPGWLRLIRNGNVYSGFYSKTGNPNTWVRITKSVTFSDIPQTMYVGFYGAFAEAYGRIGYLKASNIHIDATVDSTGGYDYKVENSLPDFRVKSVQNSSLPTLFTTLNDRGHSFTISGRAIKPTRSYRIKNARNLYVNY